MAKNYIKITDWAGNVLFAGHYKNKEVDTVINANRCDCGSNEECKKCDGTGYIGDIEIEWDDRNDERNVYEFINY